MPAVAASDHQDQLVRPGDSGAQDILRLMFPGFRPGAGAPVAAIPQVPPWHPGVLKDGRVDRLPPACRGRDLRGMLRSQDYHW
jgi:hypothetical protein